MLRDPVMTPFLHPETTLPPDVIERLRAFAALLGQWTRTINLVAPGEDIWSRHVLDSLRLLPLIPPGAARGIDLGSGAGLPGLVLAVASGIPFDLIEANRRKAAFLSEAQRVTCAPVHIHCTRIEAARLPPAPLVTARALAPLAPLLALAAPLLAAGGTGLFPKGARGAAELAEARRSWRLEAELVHDTAHPGPVIVVVTGLARA